MVLTIAALLPLAFVFLFLLKKCSIMLLWQGVRLLGTGIQTGWLLSRWSNNLSPTYFVFKNIIFCWTLLILTVLQLGSFYPCIKAHFGIQEKGSHLHSVECNFCPVFSASFINLWKDCPLNDHSSFFKNRECFN